MPPLKCCKKTWSVGSDDFVLSSVVGIIFHTVWLGGLIAFTIVVLVGRDCFPEGPRKKLVFAFIFSQIALQVLVLISEGFVGFISSRGTISNSKPRKLLPHFLRLRAVLYAVEILGCVLGCYVAWSPYIQDHIDCERANRVRQAIEAYVISVIVVLVIIAVLFIVYFDPLGLQTPSLLKELNVYRKSTDEIGGDEHEEGDDIVVNVMKVERKKGTDKTDKVYKKQVSKRLYSASSRQRWRRRVKVLCCCAGSNDGSKTQAMEDIAHAMATMFDGVQIVPTDFMAALMLVHRDQKEQIKKDIKCDLGAQLKKITYDNMDDKHFPPEYNQDAGEHTIHFDLPDIRLLQDIRHYLNYALGIYGWPIQVYLSPLVGSVCLCANLRCRALHRREKDFLHDNCCLANTAALQLQSELTDDNVICASYKNEVHWPPYSLCYDPPRNAVVLSIRGSMSLRDALTDMHMSMIDVKVDDEKYKDHVTKVHAGMYNAATNIKKEIKEKLKEVLQGGNYKFIITGHSLGAGVGAILALLYRRELPSHQALHCYAFSPPGSLFTLPLVEYSKSFITTIIYGNDIVPRLTFRSLLYLKRNMTHLVYHCEIPKHAILCPKLFSCCYQQHHYTSDQGLQDKHIYDDSTEKGVFKTPRPVEKPDGTKDNSLHQFVEKMYTVEQAPAFVPGKVLYIRETGKRIHRRFWNVIGEKEVYAVWMPNAEFSHIIVDSGIFDDHLPDTIQEVVERLYQHQVELSGHKVATLDDPIQLDVKSDSDKKENTQPTHDLHSDAVFGSSASEPVCKQNGTNKTDGKEDTITAAHVSRTEAIVHAFPEGENGLLTAQEDSTSL